MYYHGYAFWGMDMIWWIVWILLMFWMFATPYSVPGQRWRRYSPLDMLQQRFAAGQLTSEEYNKKKNILEKDGAN